MFFCPAVLVSQRRVGSLYRHRQIRLKHPPPRQITANVTTRVLFLVFSRIVLYRRVITGLRYFSGFYLSLFSWLCLFVRVCFSRMKQQRQQQSRVYTSLNAYHSNRKGLMIYLLFSYKIDSSKHRALVGFQARSVCVFISHVTKILTTTMVTFLVFFFFVQVAGASLDVYPSEPPPPELEELIMHPNVVCSPHLGASTQDAQARGCLVLVCSRFVHISFQRQP